MAWFPDSWHCDSCGSVIHGGAICERCAPAPVVPAVRQLRKAFRSSEDFDGLSASEVTERLEEIRKWQELTWYDAGYSQKEIVAMFQGWPEKIGYPAYEWTVGNPPPR